MLRRRNGVAMMYVHTRRYPRVVVDLPARLVCETRGDRRARVVDVARGGIFVGTERPAAIGAPIRLSFRTLTTRCDASGRVVWRRVEGEPRGFGVEFDSVSPQMNAFVAQLERLSVKLRPIFLADVLEPRVEVDETTTS